jgi:hypothetical protein
MPNASGTLALTSNLTSYVPYTGATTNVDLGSRTLTTNYVKITSNTSTYLSIWSTAATGNHWALVSSDNGNFYIAISGATINAISISPSNKVDFGGTIGNGTYTYTLPGATGTLALTSQLHDAVTIGTANGLSLSGQALSLALASTSATGALSSTDWNTFNGKQAALSGTGFVKISGTTISYDNSTYLTTASAGSTYVPYTGATGSLFLGNNDVESRFVMIEGDGTLGGILSFKQYSSSWQSTTDHTNIYATGSNKLNFSFFQTGGGGKFFNFDVSSLGSTARTYTMPDASGTLALTSNLSAYLPLAGGTMTGKIAGVNLEFSNPSATFVSGGVNNSTSTHIIAVPSGSTWSNGASFSANNNAQFLNFGGSQSIQNGAIVAGTVNVNRISFTAGSATVTMSQSTGIRAMAGMQMLQQTGGTINGTVSHGASMLVQGVYPTNTANITFTNYYGVLINPLDEWGGVTFGSRYGIYQAGASDANFFAGNVGIGTPSPGNFDSVSFTGPFLDVAGMMQIKGTSANTIAALQFGGSTYRKALIYSSVGTDDPYFAIGVASSGSNSSATERMLITSGGNVAIGTTIPFSRLHVRDSDVNTGTIALGSNLYPSLIYSSASSGEFRLDNRTSFGGFITFYPNGQATTLGGEAMRITSERNVWIGGTGYSSIRLSTRGENTSSTHWAFMADDVNGANMFGIRNDQQVYAFGISSGTGTALVLTSGGYIVKSSSSIRYKKDVQPIDIGLDFILGLNPVSYILKDGNVPQVGFIAEDFPEDRLVSTSMVDAQDESKGYQKEGVNYAQIVAPLVKAIQEQQAQIEELKALIVAK